MYISCTYMCIFICMDIVHHQHRCYSSERQNKILKEQTNFNHYNKWESICHLLKEK